MGRVVTGLFDKGQQGRRTAKGDGAETQGSATILHGPNDFLSREEVLDENRTLRSTPAFMRTMLLESPPIDKLHVPLGLREAEVSTLRCAEMPAHEARSARGDGEVVKLPTNRNRTIRTTSGDL